MIASLIAARRPPPSDARADPESSDRRTNDLEARRAARTRGVLAPAQAAHHQRSRRTVLGQHVTTKPPRREYPPMPEIRPQQHILAGRLVPGETVEMTSQPVDVASASHHESCYMAGIFVGDYFDKEAGESYFLFRHGRMGKTRQPYFGVPTSHFSAETLQGYGPLERSAQAVHEGRA
ncbi:hypothetical protein [Nocardia niwae]|uniref:hypothetical protein n=1 Tax=Nocardia niwae TaxID=626084 RepID=UPI0033F59C35